MIWIVTILVGLGVIFAHRYDVRIRTNWQGTFVVWRTIRQDMISGEYYEIYLSKKLW